MRSHTLVATSICLGLLLGVPPAHGNQLVTASLKNGSYGTGTAVAPTTGVVNSADGVVFVATETATGRSNGLINWQIGNNSQWRRTGTITFLIKASRASVSASGGQIVNDNYGFGTFRNGQSTFAIAGGPVLNGPGLDDDRLRITWNTWHSDVWYPHNPVDLEFDKWYSIGFVWGKVGTQFEVWVNQQLVSAQNVPGVAFPWGSDGLQSGFNMGFGDNHERGIYSGYESIAGVKFADVRMWNEVRAFGDTVLLNSAPAGTADSYSVSEDGVLDVPFPGVLANDSDLDNDGLTASLNISPSHGTVVLAPTGAFTYTPTAGYNGSDSFKYMVSDGVATSGPISVGITVNPVNDAPVANPDTATTPEDTPIVIDVLANDTDADNDSLTVTQAAASSGSVSFDGGQFTYTPAANANGAVGVNYTVSDGHGGTAQGSVTITVTPVNDAPLGVDDQAQTVEDGIGLDIDVLGNDIDVDGDVLAVTGATATNGTAVFDSNHVGFVPAANFHGTATLSYTLTDGHGESSNAVVTITVTPLNDDPVAAADAAITAEDSSITVDVTGNDSDADGDQLTITGATASVGSVAVVPGGLLFTPPADYHGGASISYAISDGHGGSASASVAVTVTSVNDAPTTSNASASTTGTAPVSFTLTAADVDGDSISFSVGAAANGSLSGSSPTFTYAANAGFSGTETLSFVAADGNGGQATGTVTITVIAPPPPPPPPPPPATSIEDMINAMRGINQGQRNSLLVRLRNAERKVSDGHLDVARNMFEQVAESVERFGGPDAATIAAAIRARAAEL